MIRVIAGMVVFAGAAGLLGTGCGRPPVILIKVTADAQVDQYDLYVRDDASAEIIFHSGFNPVLAPGERADDGSTTRDLTVEALKIALKLSKGGKYTLLLVGVRGPLEAGKPGVAATQFFWAGRVDVDGTDEIDAKLLTVPPADDQDRDLWPDASDFPAHVPEAQRLYAGHLDLLDCDDKIDNPAGPDGTPISSRAENINPFAPEICGDGYDENCNGDADDPCVDADGDGDPKGDDCDDKDPARHHGVIKGALNPKDPYPDPQNCCGYNLGKEGTAEDGKDFTGDPLLCPKPRCGDGIDESCRGNAVNDPSNDTICVIDKDCDHYPADVDCDDNDPSVHPGALEICGNGKNESCSPAGADSGCVPCDLDGDGYQRNDAASNCPHDPNLHPGMVDCNDNDAGVYPGAAAAAGNKEGGINAQGKIATALKGMCRHVYEDTGLTGTPKIADTGSILGDADCNGVAFEACPPASCDADGDGFPANNCGMGLPGPYDCNDNDPTIFPSAPDRCGDGVDGNCSGADTPCNGMDKDGDGYLPPADCDDTNPNVHPFALEKCNGIDDDCDGDKDEGNPDPNGVPLITAGLVSQCTDDNDGECGKVHGRCVCSPTTPVVTQDVPGNRMLCSGETSASARLPHCFGAGQPKQQSCGDVLNIDDDCDGRFDDPTGTNLAVKGMSCGLKAGICKPGVVVGCVQTPSKTWYGASPPAGRSHWECSTDTIAAMTSELCNGFNDTCDGILPGNESDSDKDMYMACSGCGGLTLAANIVGCGDCADGVAATHPGANEKCNGIDDDCNPATADGTTECVGGTTCCSANGGICQNLNADTNYCGACNVSCANKIFVNICQAGGCICKNLGSACGTGFWCDGFNAGGTCTPCNTKAHCSGACTACTGTQVCRPDGSGCTGCNTDADCDVSNPPVGSTYCDGGGTCQTRKGSGAMCGADHECSSGYCTDGVCCNTPQAACTGCKQCNRAGSAGTCTNSAPGTNFHGSCMASLGGCTSATCNGAGSCAAADGAACSAITCTNNATESHTQDQQCSGGVCGGGQVAVASCGDYKCFDTNVCATTCTSDAQCQSGKPYCYEAASGGDGHCYAKHPAGDACTANNECDSGACVGLICCGMGSRPLSCGAGTTTTTCIGAIVTTYTCTAASTHKSCSTAINDCSAMVVCSAGALTPDTCSGGVCVPDVPAPCTGDFACANGTSCLNKCSDDAGCRPGFWCKGNAPNGSCAALINSGSNCDDTKCAGTPGTTCKQCIDAGMTTAQCGAGPKCP